MNIRSIYHNFEELQLLISSFETLPVAICLTEIWLRKDDTLESFRLDGYQKPLLVSHSNKSSGAAIYLLEEYVPEEIVIDTLTENKTIKISNNSIKIVLCCIYRAHTVKMKQFLTDIDEILVTLNEHSEVLCILGDFNLDMLTESNAQKQYNSILNQNGFIQTIKEPTRVTPDTKTIIDHVLIRHTDESQISSGVMKTFITDHYATYAKIPVDTFPKTPTIQRNMIFFKKECKATNFLKDLQRHFSTDWCLNDDLNPNDNLSRCENLIKGINQVIDRHSVNSSNKVNKKSPPWYNNYLKNLMAKRAKLYRQFSDDKSIASYNRFRLFRSKVHKSIINVKRRYYNDLFENCLTDKRAFFRNLNNLTGRINKGDVNKLIVKGDEITEPSIIAEKFNEHFAQIGKDTKSNITDSNVTFLENGSNFSMYV